MGLDRDGGDDGIARPSVSDLTNFDVVFECYFDDIYRFIARRLGRDLADDLTASVFVEAFAGRASFDGAMGSVRPWLFGIATNLVRRHHRTEERRLRAFARHGVDPVQSDAGDVDRVETTSEGPRLARALAGLAQRDRDVLLLYAWADMTYEEIAEALGIPVGTVRSRLARARQAMRRRLATRQRLQRGDTPLLIEGEFDG
jgi:RNA polymerase sigma-70 factor (ECF subfamily)